jgi:hypothetical protein
MRHHLPVLFFISVQSLNAAQGSQCAHGQYDASRCIRTVPLYTHTINYFFSSREDSTFELTNQCGLDVNFIATSKSGEKIERHIGEGATIFLFCEPQKCKEYDWSACSDEAISEFPHSNENAAAPPVPSNSDLPTRSRNSETATLPMEERSPPKSSDIQKPVTVAYVQRKNYDAIGFLISEKNNATESECNRSCSDEAKCVVYTYDRWNHLCFLKSDVTALRLEPRATSGFRKGASIPEPGSWQLELYRKRDFKGSPISAEKNSSLLDCQTKCRGDVKCLGYTFASDQMECRTYSQVDGWDENAGIIGGLKRGTD